MTVRELFEYAIKNNAEDCDIVTVDYDVDGGKVIGHVMRVGIIDRIEQTIEVY